MATAIGQAIFGLLTNFSVSVTDIQGPAFLSPLAGQWVSNLSGLVTAKGSSGFWISGPCSEDERISNGLYVYSTPETILSQVAVGDLITLSGDVTEYRSNPSYLFSTELSNPSKIVVESENNTVAPLILGRDRSPPTEQLSALDNKDFLSVPNNQSLVSTSNSTLIPDLYGLDFWESLEGQLVLVPSPIVTDFNNHFGDFWVYGSWNVTGKNERGGITMIYGPDGRPDANPEVLLVGPPLDGTRNPTVAVGQELEDITGVIVQQHGYFYVLPTTVPIIRSSPNFTVHPTSLLSSDTDSCTVTIGDYNVENMAPTSAHMNKVAEHITLYLRSPDILFLQEIQDNSGPANDGTVSANLTLSTLVNAIANTTNGTDYSFIEIPPIDGQDGGQPGGNIRAVYLYRADKFRLAGNASVGDSLDATTVTMDEDGKLGLTYNPGRIDPTNGVWNSTRKPLVALWESILPSSNGDRFFTVNLHLTSKSGSTSVHGDSRTPINLNVDKRANQADIVADFVESILKLDENANIITGGDCNEFILAESVFVSFKDILSEVDEAADVPETERYTYAFAQNNEQIDHLFVSRAIRNRGVEVEHVHVNNWAPSVDARASDHDPTVAKLAIC